MDETLKKSVDMIHSKIPIRNRTFHAVIYYLIFVAGLLIQQCNADEDEYPGCGLPELQCTTLQFIQGTTLRRFTADGECQERCTTFVNTITLARWECGLCPTPSPTQSPTETPTVSPTFSPTESPTTLMPTAAPSPAPSAVPTISSMPSAAPTLEPTPAPTTSPTFVPTFSPTTSIPTLSPSSAPSSAPSISAIPSWSPSFAPSAAPTISSMPSAAPSSSPTPAPTTAMPSPVPTLSPTPAPTTAIPTSPAPTAKCASDLCTTRIRGVEGKVYHRIGLIGEECTERCFTPQMEDSLASTFFVCGPCPTTISPTPAPTTFTPAPTPTDFTRAPTRSEDAGTSSCRECTTLQGVRTGTTVRRFTSDGTCIDYCTTFWNTITQLFLECGQCPSVADEDVNTD